MAKIAVHAAKGCCTTTTMTLTYIKQMELSPQSIEQTMLDFKSSSHTHTLPLPSCSSAVFVRLLVQSVRKHLDSITDYTVGSDIIRPIRVVISLLDRAEIGK